MARWLGLTMHQQSHQMERCTAHGAEMSQVTKETRIVLTSTSSGERGMTTRATLVKALVPLSFAKESVKNMGD